MCDILCPTPPTYTYEQKDVLVSSSVSYGSIRNTLRITAPDSSISEYSPVMGTDIPITVSFDQEGLYKAELISRDDGDNVCSRTCYTNVTIPPSCDVLRDNISCEAHGCYWYGGKCSPIPPTDELTNIYQPIIDKEVCISDECLYILDLDNDGS